MPVTRSPKDVLPAAKVIVSAAADPTLIITVAADVPFWSTVAAPIPAVVSAVDTVRPVEPSLVPSMVPLVICVSLP